jgi:hypothetical protein
MKLAIVVFEFNCASNSVFRYRYSIVQIRSEPLYGLYGTSVPLYFPSMLSSLELKVPYVLSPYLFSYFCLVTTTFI